MKTVTMLFALLACGYASQLSAQNCTDLDRLQWLVGDWQSHSINRLMMESWEKTSHLTYEGVGITMSATGEEISREWLRLLSMKDQIFYLAKVDHNSLPVPFVLTHCQDERLVFQNPQHDFPKVITYQKQGDDQLIVTVGDGAERTSTIKFQKQ